MHVTRHVVSALALFCLAGCGFQPLYGETSAVGTANLTGVRVATIQDLPDPSGRSPASARAAQQLRNFLLDRVTQRGQSTKPQYDLRVTLSETKYTTLGIRSDETATRGTLTLTANYAVVRLDGGGTILSASTRTDVSYNILRNEFATLSAENDARNQAARDISDTIALEVANAVGAYRQGLLK